MKKARTKCYIYTRVSTAMQVDGYSLDAQREKLRKYADYEDMVIAGEYSDEGFPVKTFKDGTNFNRCCEMCKTVKTAFLMFWYSNSPVLGAMRPMF